MYEIFEKLLKMRGITAYKVSKDTGITTATLTSWKQGKYVPKKEKMQKIADYFNVSVDYLMGIEQEEKPQYYLNSETAKIAQEVFDNKELRLLFDASRNASPEDIRLAAEMLSRMKKEENHEE